MKNYIHALTIFIFTGLAVSCQKSVVEPYANGQEVNEQPAGKKGPGGTTCLTYHYYYNNQKVSLGNVLNHKIIVGFADGMTRAQKEAIIAQYAFLDSVVLESTSGSADLTVVALQPGLSCVQVQQALQTLQQHAQVRYANPFFRVQNANQDTVGITNQFIVTLEQKATEADLLALSNKTKTQVIGPLFGKTYLLSADKSSQGNAVEMANYFHESKAVEHAEPEFYQELRGW